ncbi:hypothetical protein ACEN2T_17340 [Pseudomonas sp. W22_MBD1_FP4]|uniref:hypothetical protein n=1 Tax=Pseudomonas sp. W22_MBD1_FP4 TaxID=3240272 RepID=UPI003F99790C
MLTKVIKVLDKITESKETGLRFLKYVALYGFPLGMASGFIFIHYGFSAQQYLLVMPVGYVIGGIQGWKAINHKSE